MEPTIASTTSIDHAAARVWDTIIVGAGLAGSIAARGLAQRGRSVLLIERSTFPRDKVCGACLNGDALAGLEAVGLGDALRQLGGHTLDRYELRTRRRTLTIPLPAGMSVSRRALDAMLARAAIDAGAAFLSPVNVKVAPAESAAEELRTVIAMESRILLRAKTVIVASGLSSQKVIDGPASESVSKEDSRIGLGLQTRCFPEAYAVGTIYMAVAPGGYVGLSRTEGDVLNLAAAVDRNFLRGRSPEQACREILATAGLPCDDSMFNDSVSRSFRGTTSLTRKRPQTASHRLFFVGDASGYVEPFTGEGMAWAVRGGRAVIPFVDAAVDQWEPSMVANWTKTTNELVGSHQWICRSLAKLLRYPRLVGGMIRIAAIFPTIGLSVVRQLNQERVHEVLNHRTGHRTAA